MSNKFIKTVRIPAIGIIVTLVACVMASASFARPVLQLKITAPDTITAGEEMDLILVVQNVGDSATNAPVVVTDTTDPGIGPVSYRGESALSTYL